jgi:hypothetical protein
MPYLFLVDPVMGRVAPRSGRPRGGMVAWGQSRSGEVIYAAPGVPPPPPGSPYSPYDRNFNLRRRVRFESYLSALVLFDPICVMPAVNKVTVGLQAYLADFGVDRPGASPEIAGEIGDLCRKWVFSDQSFGRLGSTAEGQRLSGPEVWAIVLDRLANGSLQQIMNLHQTMICIVVGRLEFRSGDEKALAESLDGKLRPAELFARRGRRRRALADDAPTRVVGYRHPGDVARSGPRDPELATFVEPHPKSINIVERDITDRDLLEIRTMFTGTEAPFIAGPSGSTADLLKLARLFGGLDGEMLKQYLLACIGYLIGAGHHSFDEIMTVARAVGLRYSPGQYDSLLPNSFKATAWYDQIMEGFFDVMFAEYWPEVAKTVPRPMLHSKL